MCPVWGGGSCSDVQSILTNAYRGVTTEGEGSHCQICAELRTVSAAERHSDKFNVGIGRDAEKVYDKLYKTRPQRIKYPKINSGIRKMSKS